jgi:uncharacterized protein YjbI with pentapeptide repeats
MAPLHWQVGEIIQEEAAFASSPSHELPSRRISEPELQALLTKHRDWLETRGAKGQRLEMPRADFAGVDLTGANLQEAILNRANFQGAELLLADLRGASLVQANLQEANLLGADFQGANLEGAALEGAAGLNAKQFAGANLQWAILPAAISEFDGEELAQLRARQCARVLALTVLACALSWLRILTTRDIQFLRDAPLVPIPGMSSVLPISGFFVVMPIVLFALFLSVHISLERLWERLRDLPAVFPDGRSADRSGPWIVMTLFRHRFRRANANRDAPSLLEMAIPRLSVDWLVPATLLLFWGRFLVMQDLHAAMLQLFFFAVCVGMVVALPKINDERVRAAEVRSSPVAAVDAEPESISVAESADEADEINAEFAEAGAAMDVDATPVVESVAPRPVKPRTKSSLPQMSVVAAITLSLALLTIGVPYGAPHDISVMPDYGAANIARWAADVFWMVGYRPYADFTESKVSTPPPDWSWHDDDLARVSGAQLNNLHLRYAQGYRTFWVNAHLWKADLRGSYFAESDFRGANLREANLGSASFDRTLFYHANLQGANLHRANLIRADLRETDLSYAGMSGAILVDARLTGANLFSADLQSAQLGHADLEKVDLRDANLSGANLTQANLEGAYLWSAKLPGATLRDADLGHAILIEADLHGSDLRGANLAGAVVRSTDFTDADISGVDFRGASGLTASQVCAAKNRADAQFDEGLIEMIRAQCGPYRPAVAAAAAAPPASN